MNETGKKITTSENVVAMTASPMSAVASFAARIGLIRFSSTKRKMFSNTTMASSLVGLAEDLYNRGVRRIGGNVVGDESYFRAEQFGNGWQWNDLQWYFGAEPSALSINRNQVDVEIKPAKHAGE